MEVSANAKERFCKDCNIPIRIFEEPYFTERLELYDPFFDTKNKWNLFVSELEKYDYEQDYFEEYNRVKDAAIDFIKCSDGYNRLNSDDMNQYAIQNKGFPAKDIFHPSNDGRIFISIDIKKANFSALRYYASDIFDNKNTWEEFISKFTDNKHIINSKYIRQVILGNCNPKKHITYEKYLMDQFLTEILKFNNAKRIVFFSNDEIVIDITDTLYQADRYEEICELANNFVVPLKVEWFELHKINGTDGYLKLIGSEQMIQCEFKGLDNFNYPFVLRKMLNQEVTENDKIFYHNGHMAKYLNIPNIEWSGSNGN